MLTPIDIQNHTLKIAVRGYSKKETDDFLEQILAGYEELYKENRELKEKISSLSDGIQYYKGMESTLQKALVLAEKTSSETQEAAKSKADALLQEAQAKADALSKESIAQAEALRKESNAYAEVTKAKAKQELEETRNHVRKLVQSYENYRLQFKKLAESQIEMLESENYSIFAPELSEMLDDAPDADAVMEADGMVPINTEGRLESNRSTNASDEEIDEFADTKDLSEEFATTAIDEIVTVSEDESFEMETNVSVEDEAPDFDEMNHSEERENSEEMNLSEEEDVSDEPVNIDEKDVSEESMSYDNTFNTQDIRDISNKLASYVSDMVGNSEEDSKEEDVNENATPRLEDVAEEVVSSSVEPQEDSPFTFIDTE